MKKSRQKKFLNPRPGWLMRRLLKKEILSVDDASIILGVHIKNIYELMRRGRLEPLSNTLPYRFSASTVKEFRRQKPGRKAKPKPQTLKRFISKAKSTMKGSDPRVEERISRIIK